MPPERPYRRVFVPDTAAGRRVDVFLSLRFTDWSRSKLARAVEACEVLSDLRPLKPSTTLRAGEALYVLIPGIAPLTPPPPLPPVLYEDDWLLILNKPPGLLTHPSGQRWEYGIIGIVREARPGIKPDLAHRLDRDTSGALVLTKQSDANRHMKELFQSRQVSKTYMALVRGVVPWEQEVCEGAIGKPPGHILELRRGVVPDGDAAKTSFEVVWRGQETSLVLCRPVTGRTHQIRVHLENLGYPILGDKIYGQPDEIFLEYMDFGATKKIREAVGFPRQCLHAYSIAFPHPLSKQILKTVAPLPEDMQRIVDGELPSWPESDISAGQAIEEEADKDVAESDI
jgi:23S rRNA pseudouridine1911/1915/1917 synthase